MSASTDSLKKKVCVTIFLDELFEEIVEDSQSQMQVPEKRKSEIKVIEVLIPKKSDFQEDLKTSENSLCEPKKADSRPRKHRGESKFLENSIESLKNEIDKFGNHFEKEDKISEVVEPSPSDSEIDLEELLKANNYLEKTSSNSFTKLKGSNSKVKNNLSTKHLKFLLENFSSVKKENIKTKFDVDIQACPVKLCDQSTQFNGGTYSFSEEINKIGDNPLVYKKQKRERDFTWNRKKRNQSTLETKGLIKQKIFTEGSTLERHYLKPILEKNKKFFPTDKWLSSFNSQIMNESDIIRFSNSYTRIYPHNRNKLKLKRFGAKLQTETFQVNIPEVDSNTSIEKSIIKKLLTKTNFLFYSGSNLKPKNDIFRKEGDNNIPKPLIKVYSNKIFNKVSQKSLKSDASNKSIKSLFESSSSLEFKPKNNCKSHKVIEDKRRQRTSEEKLSSVDLKKTSTKGKSNIHSIYTSKNSPVCDSLPILRQRSIGIMEEKMATTELAEVFVKRKPGKYSREYITEFESEITFADNDSISFVKEEVPMKQSSCAFNIKDETLNSKSLRRLNTVEIIESGSSWELGSISAEVILVCDGISQNDIKISTWEGSISTLGSLSGIRQCYLKDSKSSSMYLLEIPYRFRNSKKVSTIEHIIET